jgi:uncharacterized protein YbjT (DUF2867 family)
MKNRLANNRTRLILVTGGTGTLGRHVVANLRDAGADVRVLSRGRLNRRSDGTDHVAHVTADLATGAGVREAVEGADIVVHCAGTAKGDDDKARHLVDAARAAGVRHLVFISVVGADRIPVESRIDRGMFGYFAAKRDAERVIEQSGIPWTTLRATQFHDLAFKTVGGMARLPVIPVPKGFRFQPVDSGEVADRLVELAMVSPQGLVEDLGGPRIYAMTDLVRTYLAATGRHRVLIGMPVPGRAAAAIRDGANLTADRAVGERTWEEFLAATLPTLGQQETPASRLGV